MRQGFPKIWYLMRMDIFSGLTPSDYSIIDRDSSSLILKKRDFISFQETVKDNIYFLKQGRIKLTRLTVEGRAITLDILKEGTIFGAIASDYESADNHFAEAMEDCLLCVMRKSNFDKLMDAVPCLSRRITKLIGLRLKRIENRLTNLLYKTVEERLAHTLLTLADEFAIQNGGRLLINIKLTHNDLAELIASTRETVTSTLNNFRQDGLIDYQGRFITIVNSQRLSEIAGVVRITEKSY